MPWVAITAVAPRVWRGQSWSVLRAARVAPAGGSGTARPACLRRGGCYPKRKRRACPWWWLGGQRMVRLVGGWGCNTWRSIDNHVRTITKSVAGVEVVVIKRLEGGAQSGQRLLIGVESGGVDRVEAAATKGGLASPCVGLRVECVWCSLWCSAEPVLHTRTLVKSTATSRLELSRPATS